MEKAIATAPKADEKGVVRNIYISRIITGLTEIGNLEIDDFDINLNISKTVANLGIFEKAYNKTMQGLMKKYIVKDEKGNLSVTNGFYDFKNESDKDEYQKQLDVLNEGIVTEKLWTIKASDLKKIKGVKGTTMAKFFELIVDDVSK